ncbi:MAG: 2-hydroxy-3-oxopropionate reductase [Firmicutes bacterium]|nr:2-hydroxy-3-oxopropionate reductase [Bacillota bacterium]
MDKIGFIGLGVMGKPMCKNLLKAGYQLFVYDIVQASVDDLVLAGAKACSSPCEASSESDAVITMLPDSPEVRQAILGPHGVIEGARSNTFVIDMSSISPVESRRIASELSEKGIRMLDAPVSGGEPKAIDGSLSIMVGGNTRDFEDCYEILKSMGSQVVLCGAIGAGNVVKLANQIIVALNIAAMSEALVFAAKAGVEPQTVYQAISGGLAGSNVLNAKAPLIFSRQFKPGFRIDLHIKDLQNVLETSHKVGVPLPLTSQIMEILQAIKVDDLGGLDHSGIIQFYEKLAGITVS